MKQKLQKPEPTMDHEYLYSKLTSIVRNPRSSGGYVVDGDTLSALISLATRGLKQTSPRKKRPEKPADKKILDNFEQIQSHQDPKTLLTSMIEDAVNAKQLPVHVDRTTHYNRLKRRLRDRITSRPPNMATVLRYWGWLYDDL